MARKEGSGPAEAGGPKPNAITIRGSVEWREWLADYAAKKRTTQAGVIDLALAEMAERDGFRSPPPR